MARVMREAGLSGVSRGKGPRTTRRDPKARSAPDLVERRFDADGPARLWVADITYVPTAPGFVSLAVVLDVFNRRVVGSAMANHLRTERVLAALDMALGQRRPASVIHHSDQGCQYISLAFAERWRQAGVVSSMGSVGECYDNAIAERFFRQPRMRAPRPNPLRRPSPRPERALLLHRGVVSPTPSSSRTGLPVADRLRKGLPGRCMNPKPSTVH